MSLQADRDERQKSLNFLGLSVVLTLFFLNTTIGNVLYPFVLMATWFHEMGHGIAGMMVGAEFETLVILANGSGYTITFRPDELSALANAFISAGGPLGPAIAGGALIIASRWKTGSVIALLSVAGAMILSALLVVDGPTGLIALPLMALALAGFTYWASPFHRQIGAQFCGLQACISTYTSLDYLFSRGGLSQAGVQYSDTEQMARALLLPYWFWGGVLTIVIAAIIAASLWLAYRR